jgi:serine/threonine protein kinase
MEVDDHCKIGDFGITKILDSMDYFAYTIVGSPFHFPPDLRMGRPYNSGIHTWSVPCVVDVICTISPAFSGHNMVAIVAEIIRSIPPPAPSLYQKGLACLVDATLSKSPKARLSLSDILTFSVLKGKTPMILLEIKQPPTKEKHKKQNKLAINLVPLCVESQRRPLVVANRHLNVVEGEEMTADAEGRRKCLEVPPRQTVQRSSNGEEAREENAIRKEGAGEKWDNQTAGLSHRDARAVSGRHGVRRADARRGQ